MKQLPHILFLFFLLLGTMDLMAQSITHAYEFPGQKFIGPTEVFMDGIDAYIALDNVDNDILEFLPENSIDSMEIPQVEVNGNLVQINSSLLTSFDATTGLGRIHIINNVPNIHERISINENKLFYSGPVRSIGFNNDMIIPIVEDSTPYWTIQNLYNTIYVYDLNKDSLLYRHEYLREKGTVKTKGYVTGDFIYYMTTLNDNEDLALMGDTLRYERDELGRRSPNFLHKINYKTGEKVWTHNIGKGRELKLFADINHNVYIDMRYSGEVTFDYKVVRLENHYGDDRVVMKIDPEGNYVDHVHVQNGLVQTTGKTTFNKDGSFQISGAVYYPTYVWIDDTDSIDFMDVVNLPPPNQKFHGYVLTFDANMDFKWHSRMDGGDQRFPFSFNGMMDGSYLTATECRGNANLIIDGNSYLGPTGENVVSAVAIHQYDKDGSILGKPAFIGPNHRVHDLEEIIEGHFLALVEVYSSNSYDFLDSTLLGANDDVGLAIIQYEGDIHDIETTISEYVEQKKLKVYPNPTASGQVIHIDLNTVDRTDPTFTLASMNGQSQILVGEKLGRSRYQLRIPDDLFPGIYILQVNHNGRIINKKIIIQ